ncbi:cathepsin L1-like [Acanthaster planci]|uniref:Cathepsin L1-like n=1 Tax=Acanthaster planci TaxID=133434 RepID=A0A8B7ZZ19_ACAPL|nr:cathepsin L1-like [Acanthaster planci]XP_022108836.1 cathepsin L1-like [Acanthaster planci]
MLYFCLKMKSAPLLGCVLAIFIAWNVSLAHDVDGPPTTDWETWKQRYRKKYGSMSEEIEKRAVWERNSAIIRKHNSEMNKTFDLAMNEFGDQEQMTRKHLPYAYPARSSSSDVSQKNLMGSPHVVLPSSVDWRKKGDVTPVRNQGQLGSAAAIAAADAVASFHAIHKGNIAMLSAQEVQDCCRIHLADFVFDCIRKLGGLCKDGDYKPGNGTCQSGSCTPYAKVPNGGKKVSSGSEDTLAQAVVTEPVMVSIDASQASFQFYSSGVYASSQCSSTQLDHSMLLVGYGRLGDQEYWICKNSWGTSWGMAGYILIARNEGNMCGIATDALYPI